jgi:cell division protein FtsB
MQQTEKYWNMILRGAMAIVAGMLLAGAILMFLPKVKQMQTYQDKRDTLKQQIEVTVAAEKELKGKQHRFLSDPAYVEKVAHEVGYARQDETIFHFSEETGDF